MTEARRLALIAGVMYLLTFVTSIPALPLLEPVTDHRDYVLGAGSDTRIIFGGVLEVLVAFTGVGTALALYPITRRVSQALALGFVASRLVEAGLILVGVVSILSVVTLRQDLGGSADAPAGLTQVSYALVAVRDWTFNFGPGVMPAINALFLATVLLKAGLVPRVLPVLGLVGAPILLVSTTMVTFGAIEQYSSPTFLLAIPIALWEFSLGCWLTFKGFLPSPVLEEPVYRSGR